MARDRNARRQRRERPAALHAAVHVLPPRRRDGRTASAPICSRIGVTRSRAALTREIRTPSEWMAPNFETVTLVTKDGQRIRGVKKAEDVFSIQIMDTRERIQGYLKSDLQEVIHEKNSLMPTYGTAQLSDGDLTDLLGYLTTLRGATPTAAAAAAAAAPSTITPAGSGGRPQGSDALAHLLRRLQRPPPQPADADHARERRSARRRSGRSRRARSAASRRRRSSSTACCTSPASTTTRGRSTRAPDARSGAIAASCPEDSETLLRRDQPRLRRARRSAVHGHARRASRRRST